MSDGPKWWHCLFLTIGVVSFFTCICLSSKFEQRVFLLFVCLNIAVWSSFNLFSERTPETHSASLNDDNMWWITRYKDTMEVKLFVYPNYKWICKNSPKWNDVKSMDRVEGKLPGDPCYDVCHIVTPHFPAYYKFIFALKDDKGQEVRTFNLHRGVSPR